jgi:hypothetical protein
VVLTADTGTGTIMLRLSLNGGSDEQASYLHRQTFWKECTEIHSSAQSYHRGVIQNTRSF